MWSITVHDSSRALARGRESKSSGPKAKEDRTRNFKERVSDTKAVLETQKLLPWVPTCKFRPFGVDTFGALGEVAQAIVQKLLLHPRRSAPIDVQYLPGCANALRWKN